MPIKPAPKKTPLSEGIITSGFAHRDLFILLVIGPFFLSIRLVELWLLVFASIVVASILRLIAEPIIKWTPIKDGIAVFMALLLVFGIIGGTFYFFGKALTTQIHAMSHDLPLAWNSLSTQMRSTPFGSMLLDQLDGAQDQAGAIVAKLPQLARGVATALASLLIVVVGGVFLAAKPKFYCNGLVSMLPSEYRHITRTCLHACGGALRSWILGQSLAMLIVGSLVAIGLSFVGVPSAGVLGLMTGMAQFVPLIGPVSMAAPGLLLAASQGWQAAMWALAVYVGVQQAEANLITPHIQSHMTSIPPALILFAILGFGLLLGPLGVMLAAPLAVVIFTFVKTLYVEAENG